MAKAILCHNQRVFLNISDYLRSESPVLAHCGTRKKTPFEHKDLFQQKKTSCMWEQACTRACVRECARARACVRACMGPCARAGVCACMMAPAWAEASAPNSAMARMWVTGVGPALIGVTAADPGNRPMAGANRQCNLKLKSVCAPGPHQRNLCVLSRILSMAERVHHPVREAQAVTSLWPPYHAVQSLNAPKHAIWSRCCCVLEFHFSFFLC